MRGYGKGSAQGGAGEDGWDGRAGCAVGDETMDRPPPPRHRQPLNHSSATRGTRGGRSRSSSRSDASRRPRPPTATPHRPPPAAAGRHDRLPPLPQRCPRVAHHPPPPGARPSRRRPAGACAPWHTPTRGERGERPTVAASPPHPAGASVDGGKRGGGGGGGRQPRQTKETCAGSWHAGGGGGDGAPAGWLRRHCRDSRRVLVECLLADAGRPCRVTAAANEPARTGLGHGMGRRAAVGKTGRCGAPLPRQSARAGRVWAPGRKSVCCCCVAIRAAAKLIFWLVGWRVSHFSSADIHHFCIHYYVYQDFNSEHDYRSVCQSLSGFPPSNVSVRPLTPR